MRQKGEKNEHYGLRSKRNASRRRVPKGCHCEAGHKRLNFMPNQRY
jgi:hypothetical protein